MKTIGQTSTLNQIQQLVFRVVIEEFQSQTKPDHETDKSRTIFLFSMTTLLFC